MSPELLSTVVPPQERAESPSIPMLGPKQSAEITRELAWMRMLIERQLGNDPKHPVRSLEDVSGSPEKAEDLRSFSAVLSALEDALLEHSFDPARSLMLFARARLLATVPPYHPKENPHPDPRLYYGRLLEGVPAFAPLRQSVD